MIPPDKDQMPDRQIGQHSCAFCSCELVFADVAEMQGITDHRNHVRFEFLGRQLKTPIM
jgi:hypothetical protein